MIKMHAKLKRKKENKLMAQRKGNLHVKDRSSDLREGPERSRYYDRCKLVRGPTAQGICSDEGNGGVRLNWHRHLKLVKEPNLVEEKPLPGQGNILFGDFQWE